MVIALQPAINDLSAPFWAATAEGRLVLPHCVSTGAPFWPPSPSSPFVTAGAVEWHDVSPSGTMLSMVVYRRAFLAELADRTPYGIALIEIAPDVRLFAHVADPDGACVPAVGTTVTLTFQPLVRGGVAIPTVI